MAVEFDIGFWAQAIGHVHAARWTDLIDQCLYAQRDPLAAPTESVTAIFKGIGSAGSHPSGAARARAALDAAATEIELSDEVALAAAEAEWVCFANADRAMEVAGPLLASEDVDVAWRQLAGILMLRVSWERRDLDVVRAVSRQLRHLGDLLWATAAMRLLFGEVDLEPRFADAVRELKASWEQRDAHLRTMFRSGDFGDSAEEVFFAIAAAWPGQ